VIKGSPNLKDEETETYSIVDGIIIMKKAVVVPPGAHIGDV
jgi:hypothetical protein